MSNEQNRGAVDLGRILRTEAFGNELRFARRNVIWANGRLLRVCENETVRAIAVWICRVKLGVVDLVSRRGIKTRDVLVMVMRGGVMLDSR